MYNVVIARDCLFFLFWVLLLLISSSSAIATALLSFIYLNPCNIVRIRKWFYDQLSFFLYYALTSLSAKKKTVLFFLWPLNIIIYARARGRVVVHRAKNDKHVARTKKKRRKKKRNIVVVEHEKKLFLSLFLNCSKRKKKKNRAKKKKLHNDSLSLSLYWYAHVPYRRMMTLALVFFFFKFNVAQATLT